MVRKPKFEMPPELNALGAAVRGLVQEEQGRGQEAVKLMAGEALKNALRPFPEYAKEHIKEKMEEAILKACDQRRSEYSAFRTGHIGQFGPIEQSSDELIAEALKMVGL